MEPRKRVPVEDEEALVISQEMSANSQAALLLTTMLGMSRSGDVSPLTPSEWSKLEERLRGSGLTPGDLLDMDVSALAEISAGLEQVTEERLGDLLGRGTSLAGELDRLRGLGIWALTRFDDGYPPKLREKLEGRAPAALFGAGPRELLSEAGVAIVGSRDIDEAGSEFATSLGRLCAESGLTVFSGGAKGTDRIGMQGSLDAGGTAVGILADSLERTLRTPDTREYISEGRLTLCTPYHPDAGFSVGNAMGRNKLIYCMADYAVVVACTVDKGGTWQGARDALHHRWTPLFARIGEDVPEGNQVLVREGALPLSESVLSEIADLQGWLNEQSRGGADADSVQMNLF